MKSQAKSAGFTLVETLMALFIFGIIMVLVTNLFRGTLSTATASNEENELLTDAQLTQQVIAGRVTDAIYVYPTGTTLALNASGVTTLNTLGGPNTGTQNWTVGTNPFLAMILPPLVPSGNCGGGSVATDGCYRLFAYYPMVRSSLLASVAGDVPNPDARNPNQWVMLEYRKNLVNGTSKWLPGFATGTGALNSFPNNGYIQGATGRFLSDYLQPNAVSFAVTAPVAGSVGKVVIQFANQRFRLGSNLAATVSTQNVTIYPRNWK